MNMGNRRLLTTTVALTMGALIALACGESPVTAPADLAPSFAKPPGAGGGPNSGTPLSITLTGVHVTEDSDGPYIDGVFGVMAIIDQNDDLKFDIDAPKKSSAPREICFHFGNNLVTPGTDGASIPAEICGGPLWNTRDVDLSTMVPTTSSEVGSRFIVTPGDGVEYKVRYGPEPLGPVCGLPSDKVSIKGVDTDSDGTSDTWDLDATGRVAIVTSHRTKGNNPWLCVGTYTMSWVATLTTD